MNKPISFTISDFNKLTLPNHTVCNRLEYIHINCNTDKITKFLDQNVMNLSKLKEASIIIPPHITNITQDDLHRLFNKIKTVETLHSSYPPISPYDSQENLVLPNLRKLELFGIDIIGRPAHCAQWLHAYAPQLESLTLALNARNFWTISFPKLTKLQLYSLADGELLRSALNAAKILNEISIRSSWETINIKDVIKQCIVDRSLQVARFNIKYNKHRNNDSLWVSKRRHGIYRYQQKQ